MRLPSKGGAAMLLTFRGLPEVSCLDDQESARDRKSTRLNSSHGYISYAVFCLKKKKKEHTDSWCAATDGISGPSVCIRLDKSRRDRRLGVWHGRETRRPHASG